MKIYNIQNSIGGWYIGNFPNAAYQTKLAEVSFKIHLKGEQWDTHYHEHLDEINFLVRGRMIIQGQEITAGQIFILERMEIADPIFLEDCEIVCVKLPNFTNDKVIINND